jgi:hypothetical protein
LQNTAPRLQPGRGPVEGRAPPARGLRAASRACWAIPTRPAPAPAHAPWRLTPQPRACPRPVAARPPRQPTAQGRRPCPRRSAARCRPVRPTPHAAPSPHALRPHLTRPLPPTPCFAAARVLKPPGSCFSCRNFATRAPLGRQWTAGACTGTQSTTRRAWCERACVCVSVCVSAGERCGAQRGGAPHLTWAMGGGRERPPDAVHARFGGSGGPCVVSATACAPSVPASRGERRRLAAALPRPLDRPVSCPLRPLAASRRAPPHPAARDPLDCL